MLLTVLVVVHTITGHREAGFFAEKLEVCSLVPLFPAIFETDSLSKNAQNDHALFCGHIFDKRLWVALSSVTKTLNFL